ncbi:discoidin domain-containing protein [Paenibacillus athensensis]|uniref:discoidin domain-containing protein n=1 Tax=Paenibacillus athensensis TaxID=1967502 RepID=UPI00106F832F|nr:discoidin domain-containing protein [Paenibacillus athensensis]MCD1260402.1 discoidin domain-containing protein [Paenibacillus athensensis]
MRLYGKKRWGGWLGMLLAVVLTFGAVTVYPPTTGRAAGSYLLSLNRPAFASSVEGTSYTADKAFDGDLSSRWSSEFADPQWIYVDLGAVAAIDQIVLRWQNSYSKAYSIQVSNDEINWTTIYTTAAGAGGVETLAVSGSGRYVRLYSTKRKSTFGNSLYEFEVYGTGGANPPPAALGPNVALNRPVTASSAAQPSANAVDGNGASSWASNETDDEWLYADLGSVRTLGRVVVKWGSNPGRTFDIQVSNDSTSWTTVYRELHSTGETLNLPMYASGRYVRMKGIVAMSGNGYSIAELQAYDYVTGDPKPSYTIPALPVISTVTSGQGSYAVNDLSIRQPRYPNYASANVTSSPIPSNDWWTSLMVDPFGSGIVALPLKLRYAKQGLGVLTPGAGYLKTDGNGQTAAGNPDFYLSASNMSWDTLVNRVTGYGDWSVNVALSDNAVDKMKTTIVKGSPYLYAEFSDPASPELFLPNAVRFFDDSNHTVLTTDGVPWTGDHIGVEVTNTDGAPTPSIVKRYYGLFAPPGTVFTRAGVKLKLQLGGGQTYLSLAALPGTAELNYFYQHGYAFVTDTQVTYSFNEATADVTTNFKATTSLKRNGFANTTLMAQLPHQWKLTTTPLTGVTYPSIRGLLKVTEGNMFTTVNKFYGVVPQFTEPGDSTYSRQTLLSYLATLDSETSKNLMQKDAYWEGKKLQPLAMGALMADQIGNESYKNLFVGRIKSILLDWYTYGSSSDDYYWAYNPDWGTLYYKHSDYSSNSASFTDHHFTDGYFVFASTILAMYDADFKNQYGGMVEQLIRDYANPSKTDAQYPFFRHFDPYEGHSWAGGYGDNANGNNQEAAGEALYSWVAEYLWGLTTGNKAYRDAGIYGFTTELKAVEQYWFNYDQDTWLPGYTHKTVGQVYGSAINFGTFFSAVPYHVYGIHWLPTAEYLTSYGFDTSKAAGLYSGLVADNGGPETGWYHTIWPIQSLSDTQAVLNKWSTANMQKDAIANTYWFVHNMATLGQRTKDIWATGGASASVYKNGSAYSAIVWNPTGSPVTVTFRNAAGTTGSATVAAKSLVKVNPQAGSLLTPPSLTASATQNNVGQSIAVTFADNAAWRTAIQTVKVDGTVLGAGQYAVTAGKITFGASVFTAAKTYAIEVAATGYANASVMQPVVDNVAPTAPANLAATAVSSSQVSLSWTASTDNVGVSGYDIYRNGTQVGTSATTSYNDTGLAAATSYSYYVKARDAAGNASAASNTVSVTTPGSGGTYTALARSGWTAVTNPVNGTPGNLFDGDMSSRWTTGKNMAAGHSIIVDLQAAQSFRRIVMDSTGNNNDYARGYEVYVSGDGSSWGSAVAAGAGSGPVVTVDFSTQTARYIQVVLTESASKWWSIREFNVYN